MISLTLKNFYLNYTVRHKKREPLEKSLLFDQESNNVNESFEIYS